MTEHIAARTGFFPVVAADEVSMTQAGSSAIFSGGDVSLAQAGSNLLVTAGSVSIEQGGAMTLASIGDVTVEQGGAVVVGARSVEIRQGFVGLALGARVSLTDSKVVLGPREAAAAGVGFGLVLILARLIAARR